MCNMLLLHTVIIEGWGGGEGGRGGGGEGGRGGGERRGGGWEEGRGGRGKVGKRKDKECGTEG